MYRQLLELESESDSEDHWFVDSVYDSDDNDAPFIPEDLSSSGDSDSEKNEASRKRIRYILQNLQSVNLQIYKIYVGSGWTPRYL